METAFTKEIKLQHLKKELYEHSGGCLAKVFALVESEEKVVDYPQIVKLFKKLGIEISRKDAGKILWLLSGKRNLGRIAPRDFIRYLRDPDRKPFANKDLNRDTRTFNEVKCIEDLVLIFGLILKSFEVRENIWKSVKSCLAECFQNLKTKTSRKCTAEELIEFFKSNHHNATLREIRQFILKITARANSESFTLLQLKEFLEDESTVAPSITRSKSAKKSVSRSKSRSKSNKSIVLKGKSGISGLLAKKTQNALFCRAASKERVSSKESKKSNINSTFDQDHVTKTEPIKKTVQRGSSNKRGLIFETEDCRQRRSKSRSRSNTRNSSQLKARKSRSKTTKKHLGRASQKGKLNFEAYLTEIISNYHSFELMKFFLVHKDVLIPIYDILEKKRISTPAKFAKLLMGMSNSSFTQDQRKILETFVLPYFKSGPCHEIFKEFILPQKLKNTERYDECPTFRDAIDSQTLVNSVESHDEVELVCREAITGERNIRKKFMRNHFDPLLIFSEITKRKYFTKKNLNDYLINKLNLLFNSENITLIFRRFDKDCDGVVNLGDFLGEFNMGDN